MEGRIMLRVVWVDDKVACLDFVGGKESSLF